MVDEIVAIGAIPEVGDEIAWGRAPLNDVVNCQ